MGSNLIEKKFFWFYGQDQRLYGGNAGPERCPVDFNRIMSKSEKRFSLICRMFLYKLLYVLLDFARSRGTGRNISKE